MTGAVRSMLMPVTVVEAELPARSVQVPPADWPAGGTCTDLAGNSASTTVTGINIDLTAPVISGSRTPAPNGAGWNNTAVTTHYTCSDALSGVSSLTRDQIRIYESHGQSAG